MNHTKQHGIVDGVRQVLLVFQKEAALFKGRPALWGAAAIISLIPAIYSSIYLGALWDPYGSVSRLPAGLVTLDEGVDLRGRHYNLGRDCVEQLKGKRSFAFVEYAGDAQAEEAVRSGEVYFALVIPRDLSSRALNGAEIGALALITSPGTSFVASLIAERFAADVARKMNHDLGVERWRVVLASGEDARDAARRLRDGAATALSGAETLRDGLGRAGEGTRELAEKQGVLAEALAGIDAQRFVSAGAELHGNTAKLASGLAGHRLLDSLAGLPSAGDLRKLADGAQRYQETVARLAAGMEKAAEGAGTLAAKEGELAEGLRALRGGSESLAGGLHTLDKGLSEFVAAMPAGKESAEDLAEPVVVRRKAYAPVACNGPAYAPYFMSLTLWLGVLMASFLFRLIVFPRSLVGKSAAAKILGKGILPCLISCAGAVFLGVAVHQFMGIPPLHPLGLYIVLLVAALSYNAIILSMVRLVGDAGKLIAVLFLVVQIAAAGGAYSIELSPHLYRALSPYLPLTHVVRGLRAAMFGSYNGEWARGVLLLIPWMIGALGLSLLSRRRFRYVEDDDYGPALDLSFKR